MQDCITNEIHAHIFLCLQSIVSPIGALYLTNYLKGLLSAFFDVCTLLSLIVLKNLMGLYMTKEPKRHCAPSGISPICSDLLSLCGSVGGERGEQGLNYHY